MLELHIANKNYSSWSLRPWVMLRELAIPFSERLHPFEPEGDWRELRAISPSGRVPCLVDDDVVVWDSLAIVEYLHERFGGVWPAARIPRAWARSAAAEMHSGFATLRARCSMSCGIRMRLREIPGTLQADIDRVAALVADGLSRHGGPYLAGDRFSAADAFFTPVAFRVQSYQLDLPEPSRAYMGRLLGLPSMREWYEAALAEPWREEAHEAECLQYGVLIADLRGAERSGYSVTG
jgi:glutathione S-transferase